MSLIKKKINNVAEDFKKNNLIANLSQRKIAPVRQEDKIPQGDPYNRDGQAKRLEFIKKKLGVSVTILNGEHIFSGHSSLQGNIENYIGMTQIPTGIAGPLAINGSVAKGEFYIPLATTEGALVASYSRGMRACRASGSITSVCIMEGVQRSPYFKFENMAELGKFVMWTLEQMEEFKSITAQSSRYAQMNEMSINIEGNCVILTFEFKTGDAAGQNMVSICTNEICKYILAKAPVKPKTWFIESNYSGDKKATALSFTTVRGKKVNAEIVIPKEIVRTVLKSSPERMTEYWIASTIGVIKSGSIGAQGQIANGLTALFLACGQDVACISEASVGITRLEVNENGDLYSSVVLPALMVGTIGGGTQLPTQRECLDILGCFGNGGAKKFAEICGAVALAGELSIAAAITEGHFVEAHQVLGRKTRL